MAGVATAIPSDGGERPRRAATAPPLPNDGSTDVPVVADVRDVRKGEVVLYTGKCEVVVNDKRLASLLFHATRCVFTHTRSREVSHVFAS